MSAVGVDVLIVLSGLPASGKTTVGRALAGGLSLPLIDKDEILEALFDTLGSTNREERYRLSRASDEVLFRLAATCSSAVLVNWWDPDSAPERLRRITACTVEVFCDCPAEVAAARFDARQRHRGHLDWQRTSEERQEGRERLKASYRGPLRLGGPLVMLDTSRPVNMDAVIDEVRAALTSRRAIAPDGVAGPSE